MFTLSIIFGDDLGLRTCKSDFKNRLLFIRYHQNPSNYAGKLMNSSFKHLIRWRLNYSWLVIVNSKTIKEEVSDEIKWDGKVDSMTCSHHFLTLETEIRLSHWFEKSKRVLDVLTPHGWYTELFCFFLKLKTNSQWQGIKSTWSKSSTNLRKSEEVSQENWYCDLTQ